MWCFRSTKNVIINSGWSKAQVRTQLIQGCIESNPGPGKKRGRPPGRKFTPSGSLDLGSLQIQADSTIEENPGPERTRGRPKESKTRVKDVLNLEEIHPGSPCISGASEAVPRGTILEKMAGGIFEDCSTKEVQSGSHISQKLCNTTNLPPRQLHEIQSLRETYTKLITRPSLRKLYHLQLPCWKELCGGICRDFEIQHTDTKAKMSWNLLCAVKQFLFLPESQLTHRQLAYELRKRMAEQEPKFTPSLATKSVAKFNPVG